MKKLALGALFAGLMAACGGGGSDVKLIDAPEGGDDAPPSQVCNPIAQTGCQANEKCTWFIDQVTPTEVGHIGCAPLNGSEVALGAACAEGPPGPQGFDNCSKGDICVALECKKICDPQMAGVATGCDAQHSCSRYSGLFEVGGTITAGACDPQCDPLNQNLLAGADNTAACGSTNPAAPNKGCYTFDFVEFSCAPVGAATLEKTDRVEPVLSPSGNPFVNGCAPGYVPFFFAMTGSMQTLCSGLCAADNISNLAAEAVNDTGVDAATAKLVTSAAPAVGDGLCTAGKKGSASGGPQNCIMLWGFFADMNGNPGPSPFNFNTGVCFSFQQFQYDDNNDMMPETPFKDCKTLPPTSPDPVNNPDGGADFFGCQKPAGAVAPSAKKPGGLKDFRIGFEPGEATAHQFK